MDNTECKGSRKFKIIKNVETELAYHLTVSVLMFSYRISTCFVQAELFFMCLLMGKGQKALIPYRFVTFLTLRYLSPFKLLYILLYIVLIIHEWDANLKRKSLTVQVWQAFLVLDYRGDCWGYKTPCYSVPLLPTPLCSHSTLKL